MSGAGMGPRGFVAARLIEMPVRMTTTDRLSADLSDGATDFRRERSELVVAHEHPILTRRNPPGCRRRRPSSHSSAKVPAGTISTFEYLRCADGSGAGNQGNARRSRLEQRISSGDSSGGKAGQLFLQSWRA